MVKKRGDIENEKVDLRKKMTSQTRLNRSKIVSQCRVNDDLEKKLNVMSVELESSQFQKQVLKSKLNELTKEI